MAFPTATFTPRASIATIWRITIGAPSPIGAFGDTLLYFVFSIRIKRVQAPERAVGGVGIVFRAGKFIDEIDIVVDADKFIKTRLISWR